jgi:hypothetical protein
MEEAVPSSLLRHISPPPPKRRKTSEPPTPSGGPSRRDTSFANEPSVAAVEAGKVKVEDHLAYFREHLSKACRPTAEDVPRLSMAAFADLYSRNQHEHRNHFVIHQHNHPQAGVHYDLRLQFSKSSSISFAIPKGLPGNPNSRSIGRMAIETRVHNLWNHLIESASHKSGSLLIWDTGTYEVLPRKVTTTVDPQTTDGCTSESDTASRKRPRTPGKTRTQHENTKLIQAFQSRYIRLRLHGTRLPKNYTVTLRLPSNNDFGGPRSPHHIQRRRRRSTKPPGRRKSTYNAADSDSEGAANDEQEVQEQEEEEEQNLDTDTDEDLSTRLSNAYPGSDNSIGSIHQRKWFLMLDRRNSGFVSTGKTASGMWERDGEAGFEAFHVRGRDFERSVVTGRLARDVESDEGVEGYVGRGGWVGITT